MKKGLIILLLFAFQIGFGQDSSVLSLTEYITYIKKYHPIVKQANLLLSESEAKLLKSRGAFDPKLEVDYDNKEFKNTEYYDKLNAAFKIPTWYGIELKGNFENNSGDFLNPEATVPEDGLYSVGVSISLAKGLLMNQRMADLKQAKLYESQAKSDNQLVVNEILFNALSAYFKWIKTYKEQEVFKDYLTNTKLRYDGIKRRYEMGESPAIDTTEARIAYHNRKLNLEKAILNYRKASLELSNFLWINDVPVEVKDEILPDTNIISQVDEILDISFFNLDSVQIEPHPKLQSLEYKLQGLEIEKRLRRNNLLPKIDVQYNFLSEAPGNSNSFNTANYKAGLAVSFPLFLRKERGDLNLTKYKIQAIEFEQQATRQSLLNKLNAVQQEIISYENQIAIANVIVTDYAILLNGEKRKFEIGESSLFLINAREAKLIENKLKLIDIENSLLNTKGKLFNTLGIQI